MTDIAVVSLLGLAGYVTLSAIVAPAAAIVTAARGRPLRDRARAAVAAAAVALGTATLPAAAAVLATTAFPSAVLELLSSGHAALAAAIGSVVWIVRLSTVGMPRVSASTAATLIEAVEFFHLTAAATGETLRLKAPAARSFRAPAEATLALDPTELLGTRG